MGEVDRARDTKLGREVAIKVLPEHFANDAERLKRFEREPAQATRARLSTGISVGAALFGGRRFGHVGTAARGMGRAAHGRPLRGPGLARPGISLSPLVPGDVDNGNVRGHRGAEARRQ